MASEEKIISVTRRHPIWQKMKPKWDFLKDSYLGGEDYVKPVGLVSIDAYGTVTGSYLFPHESETLAKFKRRHVKSYPLDFCKLPINTYNKYLFSGKSEIVRDFKYEKGTNENYKPYILDIDLYGLNISAFMSTVLTNMCMYGITYNIVDKQPIPRDISNLEDQIKGGYRAYATNLTPDQVIDWSYCWKTRQYNWVLIQTTVIEDSDYTIDRSDNSIYYLWTPKEVYILDKKGSLKYCGEGVLNPIQHNLGIIPIYACLYSDIDYDKEPESMLSTIAMLQREIYNTTSLYQEELYKLAFAQLMKQRGKNEWIDDNEDDGNVLSTEKYLDYAEGANPPQYLQFPVDTLVEKRAYINDLILNIFRLSNLEKQDGMLGSEYQSGLAMAWSFNDTYYTVSQMGQRLEYYENRLWDLINLYDGSRNEKTGLVDGDIKIDYPSDYDILSSEQKRENYKLVKEQLTMSPHAQMLADYNTALEVLELEETDEDAIIIQKELKEGYDEKLQTDQADKEARELFANEIIEESKEVIENDEIEKETGEGVVSEEE